MEGDFSADNQDEMLICLKKEVNLNNDVSFIYEHKILFIATFVLFLSEKTSFRLTRHVFQAFWLNFLEFSGLCQKP